MSQLTLVTAACTWAGAGSASTPAPSARRPALDLAVSEWTKFRSVLLAWPAAALALAAVLITRRDI